MTICLLLWTPTTWVCSSRIIYHATRHKILRIGLWNILETSNKICNHHICPRAAQLNILWDMVEMSIWTQKPPTKTKAVVSYWDDMAQYLSRYFLTTCEINAMMSDYILFSLRRSNIIPDTSLITLDILLYIKTTQLLNYYLFIVNAWGSLRNQEFHEGGNDLKCLRATKIQFF